MSAEPVRKEPPRLAVIRDRARLERDVRATATVVGAPPALVNLLLYQGDDFYLDIILSGSGAIDLTSYTPKAEIRPTPGSATLIASFAVTITGATTMRLHLLHAQAELLVGDAAWDVQITDSAGVVTTVAYGSITLTKQVTT